MNDWVAASIIVLFAATLQALTGFGFAIMATPFLLLLFNSRDCIQISILLSFFIAVVLVPRIREKISWDIFRRLAGGSLFGIPIGLLLFANISLDKLKMAVSVTVLVIAAVSLVNWHKRRSDAEEKNYHGYYEVLAGFCAGILTTSIGMPGVPLAIYFNAKNTPIAVVRSTTLAFFAVVYAASILTQLATIRIGTEVLFSSLTLTPATVIGIFLGHFLFPKIRQGIFQLIINLILIYTALYMLIRLG